MAKTTSQIVAENKRKRAQERETDYQRNRQSVRMRKEEIADQRRSPASRGDSTSGTQAEREQLENIISPKFFSQMLGERKNNLGPQKGYGGNETGNFAYPELHEFVSPAFFYQMTKDARDNRNLGKGNETGNFPKLEELVSPEFFNQMLDQPTKNRDQKKRDLWEYNQGYHTQTDQVIYGLDMYEISRMTNQERSALEAYMWAKNGTTVDGTGAVVDDLPQKKQDVLNLLGGRYDIRRIDELAETYGRSLEAKAIQAARERGEQRGKGDAFTKFWSSALTVPASLGGDLVSPLYRLNELASSTGRYSGFAPNSLGGILDVYSQSVRNAVEEDIRGDGENGWRNMAALGYRGGMGALDAAARIALYQDCANIFSGIGAFGDRITDASSKDASYGEALTLAGADALITAALQKIPMDQLLGTARSDPKGFFGMLGDAVKAVGAQVGTGGLDYFANMAVEQAVLQDRSGYSREVALKMLDGTNFEDAKRAVDEEIRKKVIEGAFVRTVSSLVSSYLMSGYSHGKRAYEKAQVRKQDQAELMEIQEALGKNAPKTLEEFQELKYNSGQWELFQIYQREIEKGKLTPLADFQLFQEIGSKTDALLVGATTSKGVQITDKAIHFSSRVIGSIEERRSGVNLEDVLEALTNPNAEILPIKYDKYGQPGQKYRYGNVEVTINPETGNLVQTNPYRSNHPKSGD